VLGLNNIHVNLHKQNVAQMGKGCLRTKL
jgi:hypothetical protein